MNSYSNLFDIIIIIGGGVLTYYALQMKLNDIIKVGIIVPPFVNAKGIKDREAFKKYAFPRHLVQGLLLILIAIVGISCDLYGRPDLHMTVYAIGLIGWIIFNLIVEKGKKKFY